MGLTATINTSTSRTTRELFEKLDHQGTDMQTIAEKRWYLVQCKPKQDFRALNHLENQQYECVLPTRQIERLRNGQWIRQDEPLFPGYLFIELDTLQDNWMPIRSTRGVSHIVRFGNNPLPVPAHVIESIRSQRNYLKIDIAPGDKVKIDSFGSNGLAAIFLEKDGSERVLLLLNILQRELQISVPNKLIERVN